MREYSQARVSWVMVSPINEREPAALMPESPPPVPSSKVATAGGNRAIFMDLPVGEDPTGRELAQLRPALATSLTRSTAFCAASSPLLKASSVQR